MTMDNLDQLERILKLLAQLKEQEVRKAEAGAAVARDILAHNRKNTMDLMQYLAKFIDPKKGE